MKDNQIKRVIVKGFCILILSLVFLHFGSCAANPPQNTPNQGETTPIPENQTEQAAGITVTPEPSPTLEEAGFTSGMYKIGQDMPAGEYKLFGTEGLSGVSYFEIAKDSSNTLESIIANDNFYTFSYVTVVEGQYFKFTDARAVSADEASVSEPVDGRYPDGMYKVGFDIPPGEYRVIPEDESPLGFGYFEITSSSAHVLDDIVANDNFQEPRYITLEDGQYVKLTEAYIVAPVDR